MTTEEQQSIVDTARALILAQEILMEGLGKANKPGCELDTMHLLAAYENAATVLVKVSLPAMRLVMQFQTKES